MGDLRLCSVPDPKAIPIIQRLNIRNLRPKTGNLFPKDFNVIHRTQDSASLLGVWRGSYAVARRNLGELLQNPDYTQRFVKVFQFPRVPGSVSKSSGFGQFPSTNLVLLKRGHAGV